MWNALTADDVLSELSPQEAAMMTSIAGDKAVTFVTRAVAAARGAASAGGNRLGPEGTVPDQLANAVIAIARWRWLIAFPQLSRLQTRERQEAATNGERLLEKVASGTVKTEVPDTVLERPAPVNAVAVVRPGRRIKTSSFDKLSST